uniref:Ty1_Copia-element protein n=1 Tax=Arabidopsis thaliana TaxID=3702 RepID=A7Y5V7_ARATH|nr:Ty1_Copia-element protein [Arabidopsis thaliana]
MNSDKTELFLAGVDDVEYAAVYAYGFPFANLPIRYLGLPLMSRKLKISEFEPLVVKIKAKLNFWAVKSLSFAGRLQLLSSVISGIVVFWMSTFRLPKGCIREIESMCARFLWSGGTDEHHKAKVSWSTVCLPKAEGGLGVRKFTEWNTALNLKLIWLLFSNSGSLWVAWHLFHNLSTSVSNFWLIKEGTTDSWNWRCLLRLRPLASKFLFCSIGNGLTASFWADSWTPFGPLLTFIGSDGPRNQRIPLCSKVADVVNGNRWLLPSPRSSNALNLHAFLTTLSIPLQPLVEDSYLWKVENCSDIGFSSAHTWNALRHKEVEKPWVSSVWFKGVTPKNAFNMWITHQDRLRTKLRMIAWGFLVSPVCALCQVGFETRDHLMLSCDFSVSVWALVRQRIGTPLTIFQNWSELILWTQNRSKAAPSTLRKLVAQAVVYALWK